MNLSPTRYSMVHQQLLAELERDARRYQYLRSFAHGETYKGDGHIFADVTLPLAAGSDPANLPAALDSAIDAAIARAEAIEEAAHKLANGSAS
jgi:hypothetical protein